MVHFLLTGLIRTTLITSALILVLAALSPLIQKRYHAGWLCAAWAVLSVRLVLPLHISIELVIPSAATQVFPEQLAQNASHFGTKVLPELDLESVGPLGLGQTINWVDMGALIWAAGFILFVIYHLWSVLRFQRTMRRTSTPAEDPEILAQFQQLAGQMGIRRPIALRCCPCLSSPMAYGLFHPVVLIPTAVSDPGQLSLIFEHELVHIRRKHLWYNLLLTAACAVHWFNPVVYFMARRAQRDLELVCDAEVMQGADWQRRKRYSEEILKTAGVRSQRSPNLSTRLGGGKRELKRRLSCIFDQPRKHRGIGALCAVVALTVVSAVFVGWRMDTAPSGSLVSSNQLDNYAQTLLSCRTPYVGNNSKVVQAVDALPLPKGIDRESVGLQTAQQPYGIVINYRTEIGIDQTVHSNIENVFYNNALILLSLIGNADTIEVDLNTANRVYTFSYTREEADNAFGRDIRDYATEEEFPTLIRNTLSSPAAIFPNADDAPDSPLPAFNHFSANNAETLLYQTILSNYEDGDPSTVTLAACLSWSSNSTEELTYGLLYVGQYRLQSGVLDLVSGEIVPLKITARQLSDGSLEPLSAESLQEGETWQGAMARLTQGDPSTAGFYLDNHFDTDPDVIMEGTIEEYARKSGLDIRYYRHSGKSMPVIQTHPVVPKA